MSKLTLQQFLLMTFLGNRSSLGNPSSIPAHRRRRAMPFLKSGSPQSKWEGRDIVVVAATPAQRDQPLLQVLRNIKLIITVMGALIDLEETFFCFFKQASADGDHRCLLSFVSLAAFFHMWFLECARVYVIARSRFFCVRAPARIG